MTTVYGASDDLIVLEGEVTSEINFIAIGLGKKGCLLIFSDGTILEAAFGKADRGIWRVSLVERGSLFDVIDVCIEEDASPHSDVAHFKDGLKWAYAAHEWERLH
jgi:hypothetical protein